MSILNYYFKYLKYKISLRPYFFLDFSERPKKDKRAEEGCPFDKS